MDPRKKGWKICFYYNCTISVETVSSFSITVQPKDFRCDGPHITHPISTDAPIAAKKGKSLAS